MRPVTKYNYSPLGDLIQVAAGRTDATGTNAAADVVSVRATYLHDEFGRKTWNPDNSLPQVANRSGTAVVSQHDYLFAVSVQDMAFTPLRCS